MKVVSALVLVLGLMALFLGWAMAMVSCLVAGWVAWRMQWERMKEEGRIKNGESRPPGADPWQRGTARPVRKGEGPPW